MAALDNTALKICAKPLCTQMYTAAFLQIFALPYHRSHITDSSCE